MRSYTYKFVDKTITIIIVILVIVDCIFQNDLGMV